MVTDGLVAADVKLNAYGGAPAYGYVGIVTLAREVINERRPSNYLYENADTVAAIGISKSSSYYRH